jgi:hypothetical protein
VRKCVIARPQVPSFWPIQEDTNLTQKEVTCLEEARFFFDHQHKNNACNLFGGEPFRVSNCQVLIFVGKTLSSR